MTIPTTIPTGGHPADLEMTELQKAVLALLGAFSSDVLKVANGGSARMYGVNGSSAPALTITSASGWTDVPSTSCTVIPQSATRSALIIIAFAGFVSAAFAALQIRFLVDGTPLATPAYSFGYNTVNTHQGWTFQYGTSSAAIGSVGTSHTVKAQIQVVTAGVTFTMDTNDSVSITVHETG